MLAFFRHVDVDVGVAESLAGFISANRSFIPDGRHTDARPQDPPQTNPEAPDRRSDDRSPRPKGLLTTDLLPTYGKQNQCVVFALRPHFRKLSGRECQL